MVTRPSAARLSFFKTSLAHYLRQTHAARELVVVVDRGEPEARRQVLAHLEGLARDDIRLLEPQDPLSLGALRNASWDAAQGEFICQWDDDDLHHPARIETQLTAQIVSGKAAVCLEEAMQFFPAATRLHCINWRATPAGALPCTLLCRRDAAIRYPETGTDSQLGEDLNVILQLKAMSALHALSGTAHLYVYVSHGANSWSMEHHRMLADTLSVSQGMLKRREPALREGLAPFDFGTGPIAVQGSNGAAFTL